MAQDNEAMSRLTLRQLRLQASELGVPLYSRKSKAVLIKEICLYQKKKDAKLEVLATKRSSAIKNQKIANSETNSFSETRVVFLPRDPEWAYVFWEISEDDRKVALSKGANRLCLRLMDVTDSQDSPMNKGTLSEVTVDSHSTDWYLPIPLGDRDYRVEIGYRIGLKWMSLAFSSSAKVPSLHPSDQILDQFVPFSLEAIPALSSDNEYSSHESRDPELHERLYQSATNHFRKVRKGSETFQEDRTDNLTNLNDSGAGLWASGRNESGIGGVIPKESSFWLVADAELIVYGSTDPDATLKISGEEVPLANDGTFRLQVPFRDGQQKYLIEATDSLGEQNRNITMNFERSTPVDNTNPNDRANSEWF